MSSTSAVALIIQAVSPALICAAGTRIGQAAAGALAAAPAGAGPWAWARATADHRPAAHASRRILAKHSSIDATELLVVVWQI
jgi:hypothetical protein